MEKESLKIAGATSQTDTCKSACLIFDEHRFDWLTVLFVQDHFENPSEF